MIIVIASSEKQEEGSILLKSINHQVRYIIAVRSSPFVAEVSLFFTSGRCGFESFTSALDRGRGASVLLESLSVPV